MRSAAKGEPIGQLIEKALEDQKELARLRITELLHKAWANAATAEPKLSEEELMDLAVAETRAVRREMAAERRTRPNR